MICKKCGVENADDVLFCTACGASMKEEANAEAVETETVVAEEPVVKPDPGKGLGLIALILSIAGLVLGIVCSCGCAFLGSILPGILCIAGFILAIIAMVKSKSAGYKNGKAIVALILSIVAIVVMFVFIIVNGVVGFAGGLANSLNQPTYYDSYYYY